MKTRDEALKYGLSFPDTFPDTPFHDQNWQLVRYKINKKAFLWTYEKDGYITRERSKEDERVTIISITQKGEVLKEKCKDIPIELGKKGPSLDKKDAEQLYRLLYMFLDET